MRFAFPPYGKKQGLVSLPNIYITKIASGKLAAINQLANEPMKNFSYGVVTGNNL
jgi:hypothetical protein